MQRGVHPILSEAQRKTDSVCRGLLIVNADDWGRDAQNTDRTRDCIMRGTVSSVSAMVFMSDSERAAEIARERGIDAGLHLNFTTPFSARYCVGALREHQGKVAEYLNKYKFAQVVCHPGLRGSFAYLVEAQREEFRRLYGAQATRLDGHHHMHLCANVLLAKLLPTGSLVRRNFSFQRGEKSYANLLYRQVVDNLLAKRHRLTDYFFSLPPIEPRSRVERIVALARKFTVELETHPVNREEYGFLMEGGTLGWIPDVPVASRFALSTAS